MQLKVNTKELRCWNAVVSVSFYFLLNDYLISASGNDLESSFIEIFHGFLHI